MTRPVPGIVLAVQRRFRTTVGKRFSRFFVAAIAAVVASQVTLAFCLGYLHWTAGRSALAAWVAGAGTSYLVSRWAWERKGRPHLLKETIPFWLVAIAVAAILTSTTKFANQRAIAMGLTHTQQVMFDGAAYFLANTVTFLLRFALFHYVLFADRMPWAAAVTREPAAQVKRSAAASVNGRADASRSGAAPAQVDGSATPKPASAGSPARDQARREEQFSAWLAQRRG